MPAAASGGREKEGSRKYCKKRGQAGEPRKQGDGDEDARTDLPAAQLDGGRRGEAGSAAGGGRRGSVSAVRQYSWPSYPGPLF